MGVKLQTPPSNQFLLAHPKLVLQKFALKKEEREHILTPVDNRIVAYVEPEEVEMLISSSNQAQGNLMMQNEAKIRVLEQKVHMTQLCEKKSFIPISLTRWRRRMERFCTSMQ